MSPARHLIHPASLTVYIPSLTDLSVPRGIQNWKCHEFPQQPVASSLFLEGFLVSKLESSVLQFEPFISCFHHRCGEQTASFHFAIIAFYISEDYCASVISSIDGTTPGHSIFS